MVAICTGYSVGTGVRLAEVPGLGVDSAQQIIAEVGAIAAMFPSPKHLASWMGARPGNRERYLQRQFRSPGIDLSSVASNDRFPKTTGV
jgi:transposase